MDLVSSFVRAQMMHKSLGVSPYGGDLNKWPIRIVDAYILLQDEYNQVESRKIAARK